MKIILLSKPFIISGWCDICGDDTKQIVAFKKYENHHITYKHKCCKCRTKGTFTSNVVYWVERIANCNRFNEN